MAAEAKWPKIMCCDVGGLEKIITGCNHIHCLPDELLLEILRRLPHCKFVIRSKCVCKRWAGVVSHPSFIGEFLGLKFGDGSSSTGSGDMNLKKEYQIFSIVMRYKPDRFRHLWPAFESFFRPSIFHAQNSSLTALHCLKDDNVSATVVGSCYDLVLHLRNENGKYDFYISNVQTRQWVVLPSAPFYYGNLLLVGLVCDPFYSCDRDIVVNVAYRCSVVAFRCTAKPSNKISAHVFSSTNEGDSQWCEKVLSLPTICNLLDTPSSFCFNGQLHFSCLQGLFGFDHNGIEFGNEIQCHFVRWPVGFLIGLHRVGVSQGNLLVSVFTSTTTLNVWILKDYQAGEWVLQHSVGIREWVSRDPWMIKKLKKFSRRGGRVLVDVMGYHPWNCDVIYVLVPGCIFVWHLSSRMVELACHIPVAERSKHYLKIFYDFPVTIPCWPTPLRPFLSSGSSQVGWV